MVTTSMLILAVSHCVTHHVGFTIPSSELDARVLAVDHHSNCNLAILTWRTSQSLSLDVTEKYFYPVDLMVMDEIKLIVVCELYIQ